MQTLVFAIIPAVIMSSVPFLFKETYRIKPTNRLAIMGTFGIFTYASLIYQPFIDLRESRRKLVEDNIDRL